MDLNDAIIHCEEVSKTCSNKQCAEEHKQLANWLKELKERRDADGSLCHLFNL